MNKKLEELKKEIEIFKDISKGNKIKADYGEVGEMPQMYHIEYIGDRCDRLYKMIMELWDELEEHESAHLPPIETPEQMQKAIDALGLGDSYEVQKRQIYASNGKVSNWEISISPRK